MYCKICFRKTRMTETNPSNGYYSMGLDTMKVPVQLFAENRRRLCDKLRKLEGVSRGSVVLLQGGGDQGRCEGDSSDVGPNFRQESYFHWCFGVLEPDYYGAIDVDSRRSVLYQPRLDENYAIIMGHIPTPEELQERYKEDVKYFCWLMPNIF